MGLDDFLNKMDNALFKATLEIDKFRYNLQHGLARSYRISKRQTGKLIPTSRNRRLWKNKANQFSKNIKYDFKILKSEHSLAKTVQQDFDEQLIKYLRELSASEYKQFGFDQDQKSILEKVLFEDETNSSFFKEYKNGQPILSSYNSFGSFLYFDIYASLINSMLPKKEKTIGGNIGALVKRNDGSIDYEETLDLLYLDEKGNIGELNILPTITDSKNMKIRSYEEGNRISISDEFKDEEKRVQERTRNYFYLGNFQYSNGKTCHIYAGNPKKNIYTEKQKMPLFNFIPQFN